MGSCGYLKALNSAELVFVKSVPVLVGMLCRLGLFVLVEQSNIAVAI